MCCNKSCLLNSYYFYQVGSIAFLLNNNRLDGERQHCNNIHFLSTKKMI